MLKYSQNTLDKEYILNLIKEEEIKIEAATTFQNQLNDEVLSYLKNFSDETNFDNDISALNNFSEFLNSIAKVSKKSVTNREKLESLKKSLNDLENYILKLKSSTLSETSKTKLDKYNQKASDYFQKIDATTSEINTFLSSCKQEALCQEISSNKILSIIDELDDLEELDESEKLEILDELEKLDDLDDLDNLDELENKSELDTINNTQETPPDTLVNDINQTAPNCSDNTDNINISNFNEKTLIISEKNNNVILPYTIEELQKILSEDSNKYSNFEDIIKEKYTKPLGYYKNSAVARFKEAYKLVRERSHGSFKHAIDLGIELFFNEHLHPAIISACKTVDELDIYLSCLEFDELEDFSFFKIIFDIMPKISKQKLASKSE
jgi:hypothetical protein